MVVIAHIASLEYLFSIRIKRIGVSVNWCKIKRDGD
jgi:hypothetical protein